MDTGKGNRGTEVLGTEIRVEEDHQPITGPWRYFVAAAPMVGFLTLVALVFYLLG